MMMIRSLLVTLLTALTFACAANPPCESSTVWYEFSEVEFCFPKDSIVRLNHLNMSEPAAEIEFKPLDMDTAFKVSFIYQSENSGLNELSDHFDKSPVEFLTSLTEQDYSETDWQLITSILRLEPATKVSSLAYGETTLVTIVNHPEPLSSVYVLNAGSNSHVLLAGDMTERQVEWLLGYIGR